MTASAGSRVTVVAALVSLAFGATLAQGLAGGQSAALPAARADGLPQAMPLDSLEGEAITLVSSEATSLCVNPTGLEPGTSESPNYAGLYTEHSGPFADTGAACAAGFPAHAIARTAPGHPGEEGGPGNPVVPYTGKIPGASWVSTSAEGLDEANRPPRYYIYSATFELCSNQLEGAEVQGSMLADDTVGVFLNGVPIEHQPYPNEGPNGEGPAKAFSYAPVAGSSGAFTSGTNTIQFVVLDEAPTHTGVDFSATVTPARACAQAQQPPPQEKSNSTEEHSSAHPAHPPANSVLPAPVAYHSANLQLVSGVVLIELPGATSFIPLSSAKSIPLGTVVDATHGEVRLTSAEDVHDHTETGLFDGGVFRIGQVTARPGALGRRRVLITVLTLVGPLPSGCEAGRAARAAAARHASRKLWGKAKGNWSSIGRYGSATVRDPTWLTEDTCVGTLIRVASGVVSVEDFPHHRTFLLRAPHSFLSHPGRGG